MLKSKVLIKVTGSIAVYKVASLASSLTKLGVDVRIALSASAQKFIGATTFEALTGNPVSTDSFEAGDVMSHISLVRWADLVITAPATANYINKCAAGIGDDLLTTLFLAHRFDKPFLLAPAMNTAMYDHPSTQAALNTLKSWGVTVLEPESGSLACGEVGAGRLLEPENLHKSIVEHLGLKVETKNFASLFRPLKVLITGGGTKEPIDDVRHLGNSSSGRTASELANRFSVAGHAVTFLRSDTSAASEGVAEEHLFSSFQDLRVQLEDLLSHRPFDVVIHAAAVSDCSVESIEDLKGQRLEESRKMKSDEKVRLILTPNPKLIPRN